jgi:transcriptional regulator with XRE-family HTH domain
MTELAEAAGLRQTDIARKMGVSDACISRWFSGETEPKTPNLQAFCRLCGTTLSAFWAPLEQAAAAR